MLQMRHISKRFPGIQALDDVSLDVEQGEILAILGENGAGKTTLVNCLYGLYTPEEGEIYWNGRQIRLKGMKTSIQLGIGMVHQHFMLIDSFTVLENIILGVTSKRRPFLDLNGMRAQVEQLMRDYDLWVDPDTPVWQLPVGMQQKVEIIKCLFRKAELLIFDEPTGVLTPQEIHGLFAVLKKLAADGKSILLITHKLSEIMEVADRVVVLRGGRLAGERATSQTSIAELAAMMIGHEFVPPQKEPLAGQMDPVLEVDGMTVLDDRGLEAVKGVSFQVRTHEIVGVAGVTGNGQTELMEGLSGMRRVERGKLSLAGEVVTNLPPRQMYTRGLSHIPEDRQRTGLLLDLTVKENMILGMYWLPPFARGIWMCLRQIGRNARALIQQYEIKTPSEETRVGTLSGGNQQKVIVSRELLRKPKVILAMQPTRGLDMGASAFVRNQLLEERRRGAGILYVSTELDEILQMSDRVLVFYNGEIAAELTGEEITVERLGLLMAGGGKRAEK